MEGWGRGWGGRGGEVGVASSLGALSVYFLLCTDQECRGEAGLGSRGKEQRVGLLLRHLRGRTDTHGNSQSLHPARHHGGCAQRVNTLDGREQQHRLHFHPDCWQRHHFGNVRE